MPTLSQGPSDGSRGMIGVQSMKLAGIIVWNGGIPLPTMENVILPIARRDLDPLVRRLRAPVDQEKVKSVFNAPLVNPLPAGWVFVDEYKGTPQVHLQYSGDGLKGTPFDGTAIDVFVCIATSEKDTPDSRRMLYIRDLPWDATNGRYTSSPCAVPAAWLTLFAYGSTRLVTSWKSSYSVDGYMTLEGEVPGTALA